MHSLVWTYFVSTVEKIHLFIIYPTVCTVDKIIKIILLSQSDSKKVTVINSATPVAIVRKSLSEAQKVLLNKIKNGKIKITKSREHLKKKSKGPRARYNY